MKGDRLTVVLENYSYGVDQLFYQNAVNGGVTIFTEGGAILLKELSASITGNESMT